MNALHNRVFWFLLVGIYLMGSLAMTQGVFFGQKEAEEPPQYLTLESRSRPRPFQPGFEGWAGGVSKQDSKTVARGAFVDATEDSRVYPHAKADAYQLRFPELQEGDIVPLFGAVYRVASMSPGAKGESTAPGTASGDTVSFQRLPSGELRVPEGATVTKDAYVFTFGKGGGGKLHGVSFQASYEKTDGGKEKLTIDVSPHQRQEGNRIVKDRGGPQTVQVGDVVQLGGVRHRVVNVVPPDPKKKIIGWFEVAQKPAD